MRVVFAMFMMLVVFGGVNYYISRRVYQGLVYMFPHIRFGIVFSVFLLLTVILILGFMRSMLPVSAGIKHVLGVISSYWMGGFAYLLIFTIVTDLLKLLLGVCRLSFAKTEEFRFALFCVTIGLTLVMVIYGIYHAGQIKQVSYEVKVEGKTDISDLNIVMISDLHLGAVGSEARLENIVDEINGLQPDLVCIAGDFFDTDYASVREPERAIEIIRSIHSTYGTYACLGNHDTGQTLEQMLDFMEKCNIRVLNDEYVVLDDRLVLVGRLDASPIGGYGNMRRKELSEFFDGVDEKLPVLVMDHNPANIATYTDEADVIVSGHTHKGQIFPGNLATAWMYTVDHGYYQKDENSPQVIVTSGIGTWGMPMRVGTDSEIISIKIIP